jgi:hypothetical protein
MAKQLDDRIWHISGHAFAAMSFGFPVFRLTVDEFPETIFADAKGKLWIDSGTIVTPPNLYHPYGSFQHTQFMERLTIIALAGPVTEMSYRGEQCGCEKVQQHLRDWERAWDVSATLCDDETQCIEQLEMHIQRTAVFVGHAEARKYITAVAHELDKNGGMSGEDAQRIWDEIEAAREARMSRPLPLRIRRMLEMLEDDNCDIDVWDDSFCADDATDQ